MTFPALLLLTLVILVLVFNHRQFQLKRKRRRDYYRDDILDQTHGAGNVT